MNILFVCVANVGRSQFAEAFFNRRSQHQATSAGLKVGASEGQTVGDRTAQANSAASTPANMMQVAREEEGLNLSLQVRTQLTPELVARADRVIVIAPNEEFPPYLQDSKVTFWDTPEIFGESYDMVRQVKDRIKEQVELLVQEVG